jgi:hypothetical protein
MGIALLALSSLFQGLSSFNHTGTLPRPRPSGRTHPVWTLRRSPCATVSSTLLAKKPHMKVPTLRVLRVSENGPHSNCAGRMVISGSMADVCAELDRLVALEDALARH